MRKKTEVIVVDFAELRDMGDVHDFFSEMFDFPEWYGRNSDALWDLLRDNDIMNRDVIFEVRNFDTAEKNMKRDADILRRIFHELEKTGKNFRVVYVE